MDDYSISSLICREAQECLDDDRLDEVSVCDGLDDDYLRTMFEREIVCCSGLRNGGSLLADDEGMKCTRSDAVSWIIKSKDTFGFRFQTMYMAVMYFDRFLAERSIHREKPWAIWLLTVACLSLAAKMEESTVPNLPSLQNQLEYYFSNQMIQRMELLVLHTLEWRLRLVTPFAFLDHFASMFRTKHHRPSEIASRSVEIILAMARDISLLDGRPSTIAAAATAAAASNDLQSKDDLDSKMKSSRFLRNLDIDGVFSCYSQMKSLGKQHRDDDDDDDRTEEWTAPTAISLPMGQSKPVSVLSAITCEDGNRSRRPKRKSPSGNDDDDPHYRDSPDCS